MESRQVVLRDAFLTSEVHRDMAPYLDGSRPLPDSGAKRHHFIPQMMLRAFALQADASRVMQLDLDTGTTIKIPIGQAASRRNLYTIIDDDGRRHRRLEAWLASIEARAADALKRFLAEPTLLQRSDAVTISYFAAMLIARTPGAANAASVFADQGMRIRLAVRLAKRLVTAPDDERNGLERALAGLRDGSVTFPDEHVVGLRTSFDAVGETAQFVFQSRWTLLRAKAGRFVTSDRGVAMIDPAELEPWAGNALDSSGTAETTVPLTPTSCLLLEPTEPWAGRSTRDVSSKTVEAINLRTYGWAQRHVFAARQDSLAQLRRMAKVQPGRVPCPRPRRHLLTFLAGRGDDTYARRHAARGWPERVEIAGSYFDYLVFEPGQNPVDGVLSVFASIRSAGGDVSSVNCRSADRLFEQSVLP